MRINSYLMASKELFVIQIVLEQTVEDLLLRLRATTKKMVRKPVFIPFSDFFSFLFNLRCKTWINIELIVAMAKDSKFCPNLVDDQNIRPFVRREKLLFEHIFQGSLQFL